MSEARAAVDEFIELLSRVITAARRVYRAVEELEGLAASKVLPAQWGRQYWGPRDGFGSPEEAADDERYLYELVQGENRRWGRVVAETVKAVRKMRDVIDETRASLDRISPWVDDEREPPIRRWTVRTEGELRALRSGINQGQGTDYWPSDLPWVGQDVCTRLRGDLAPLVERFEELKSVRFTGIVPRSAYQPPFDIPAGTRGDDVKPPRPPELPRKERRHRGSKRKRSMQSTSASKTPRAVGSDADALAPPVPPVPAATSLGSEAPSVVLGGRADRPIVCGQEVGVLTEAQFDVIVALIAAGDVGLSKDGLVDKSERSDAVGILKRMIRGSPLWAAVAPLPGRPGGRYRILGGRRKS